MGGPLQAMKRLATCLLLTAIACSDDSATQPTPEPETIASITVEPATATFESIGATVQLTATARTSSGNVMSGPAFIWSSSDSTIASVSTTGTATAVSNGTVTIRATVGTVSGSAAIVVLDHSRLVPASIDLVSGNNQIDTVGQELTNPIVVQLLDSLGRAVSATIVNFVVVEGEGSVFAGAALTSSEGVAQERWTLGTIAGENVLEVRAVDANTGEPLVFGRFEATAIPGPATDLGLSTHALTLFLGDRLDLRTLLNPSDAFGNATTVAQLTITVDDTIERTADSIWADQETLGVVQIAADSASDTLRVAAVYDLRNVIWHAFVTCRDRDPNSSAPDSVRYAFVSDSVQYGVFPSMDALNTTAWFYFSGEHEFWSGPTPTMDSLSYAQWVIQTPHQLEYGGLSGSEFDIIGISDDAVPPTYTGGTWACPTLDGRRYTTYSTVTVRLEPAPQAGTLRGR